MVEMELESPKRGQRFNPFNLSESDQELPQANKLDARFSPSPDLLPVASPNQIGIEATPPAAAGDNSLSVNSKVKTKSEDNSSVASSSEGVASSPPLRRNSDGIRRISEQNTSHLPSGGNDFGDGVAAQLVEAFGRFAEAEVVEGRLRWRADRSKYRHLVVWKVTEGCRWEVAERRVKAALGTIRVRSSAGNRLYWCLIESEVEPTDTVERFTSQIGCLTIVESLPAVTSVGTLLDDIEKFVVPIGNLAAFARTRGFALKEPRERMLWDDDPAASLRRIADFLSRANKQPPTGRQLVEQALAMGFDALWDDPDWRDAAERLSRKRAATWDATKAAKSPVFRGCFTTLLKIAIPEEELTGWSRQRLHLDEVEAVLDKITRNVLINKRANGIARNYWKTAWEKIGERLGRKMNKDKIGRITDLLVRHGFLTKRRGYKQPSRYGLGPKNPFAHPALTLPPNREPA